MKPTLTSWKRGMLDCLLANWSMSILLIHCYYIIICLIDWNRLLRNKFQVCLDHPSLSLLLICALLHESSTSDGWFQNPWCIYNCWAWNSDAFGDPYSLLDLLEQRGGVCTQEMSNPSSFHIIGSSQMSSACPGCSLCITNHFSLPLQCSMACICWLPAPFTTSSTFESTLASDVVVPVPKTSLTLQKFDHAGRRGLVPFIL